MSPLDANQCTEVDWLGLDGEDPERWTVDGTVVLDIELMSPYLVDPPLPVVTFRELAAELEAEHDDETETELG